MEKTNLEDEVGIEPDFVDGGEYGIDERGP